MCLSAGLRQALAAVHERIVVVFHIIMCQIYLCIFSLNCRNQVLSITLGWPRLQVPSYVADLVLLASTRLKLSQALGGSVAIAVGGFLLNSIGPVKFLCRTPTSLQSKIISSIAQSSH